MIDTLLYITLPGYFQDIVLMMVRLLLFVTFIYEAWVKFKDIKGFSKSHSMPIVVSYFVATAELLAGISMLTGLLSDWAAIGIMVLMLGTTYMQLFTWKNSYWASKSGWEYDLIQFVFAAIILVFGPGMYALTFT